MKFMLTTIILFALVVFSCAQDEIPGHVSWNHSYKLINGLAIDSTDLEFELFYSPDSLAANYTFLATVADTIYSLKQNEFLYIDDSLFFYVYARRISTGSRSGHSSIVGDYFPIIEPEKPYNLRTIKIP